MYLFAFKSQKQSTLFLLFSMAACALVQQVRQKHTLAVYTILPDRLFLSTSSIEDSGSDVDTLGSLSHLRWMMQK